MNNRSIRAAAALIVIAGTAGCAGESEPERAKDAKITVDAKTQTTREISCTQVEWSLVVDTNAGPTRTHSLLQLGGEKPIAKTVDISNFDGFSGVAGDGVGQADVSLSNNDYVIAGIVEGSDPDHPGKTKTAPFRIETSC